MNSSSGPDIAAQWALRGKVSREQVTAQGARPQMPTDVELNLGELCECLEGFQHNPEGATGKVAETLPSDGNGSHKDNPSAAKKAGDSEPTAGKVKITCEQVARAALGDPPKRAGVELLWHCPNHEDKRPSLSINPKKNVFMCGPCDTGGTAWALAAFLSRHDPSDIDSIKAWLREHGLSTGNGKRKASAKGELGPIVETYDYVDESGALLFQVCRHNPKDFRQRRPDGKGGWIWNLDGARRVLYGLPKVIAAESVSICEGEKDVETARALGFTATCNPHGAGKWRPEYSEPLRGKRVNIIADADGPGRTHAAQVASSLFGKVEVLKVLELPGTKDLSEWVEHGGDREALYDLIESAPEWKPATGIDTLNAVMRFVRRFVCLTEAQARAVTLWVAHTHAVEAADFTPYLNISSAEKESGKTRLLDVLKLLVANPWGTENASVAAMVRKIHGGFEKGQLVTVLFDERDSQTGGDRERAEAIRGILNSGYERGGCYSRCVGEGAKQEVVDFETFGAKALAGIGSVSDTVASRSIPIRMKRARRGEVSKFRKRGRQGREALAAADKNKTQIAAWCAANLGTLSDAQPDIPQVLTDRQADVCEPLLAIADLAGGNWPEAARRALLELCTEAQIDDDSDGVKLLADMHKVFYPQDDDGNPLPIVDRISSIDVAQALGEMEDRPWAEWGRSQKPITQPQLARLLSRHKIRPRTMRFPDGRRLKGYEREWFEELWPAYLSPDSPLSPSTPDSSRDTVTNQYSCGSEPLFQSVTPDACHASENAVSPNKNAGCHGVTAQKPGDGEKQAKKTPEKELEWEA